MCAHLFITKMVSAYAGGFDKRGRGGACVPARAPRKGASIVRWRLSWMETSRLHMEACLSQMEMKRLWMAAPHFGMATPLRGRSGGHTGTAPTISTHVAVLRR